jgi:hypothetical protein
MSKTENTSIDFREAADKVWDMATEYEKNNHRDIARVLKDLAGKLHDCARVRECEEDDHLNKEKPE